MTETFAERFVRLGREKVEAREAARAYFDAAVKAKYAELRERDRREGRDTSGKSVAARRTFAHDTVAMYDAEYRRLRDVADAAEREYRALTEGRTK
jgi:hypothetical protein